MEMVGNDARVGPMHISLYVAILHLWAAQGRGKMVEISARKLMPVAKIGGVGPYHRTIRQLHAYGYVKYEPSYNPEVPSRVYLLLD
jgi:hypothetical protein